MAQNQSVIALQTTKLDTPWFAAAVDHSISVLPQNHILCMAGGLKIIWFQEAN